MLCLYLSVSVSVSLLHSSTAGWRGLKLSRSTWRASWLCTRHFLQNGHGWWIHETLRCVHATSPTCLLRATSCAVLWSTNFLSARRRKCRTWATRPLLVRLVSVLSLSAAPPFKPPLSAPISALSGVSRRVPSHECLIARVQEMHTCRVGHAARLPMAYSTLSHTHMQVSHAHAGARERVSSARRARGGGAL